MDSIYDDRDDLEVLLLHPSRLLEGKFANKPHKKLLPKKRWLYDDRYSEFNCLES